MDKTKPRLAANETAPIAGKAQILEIDGCKVTIHFSESGATNIFPQISKTLLETAKKGPEDNLHDS